MPHLDTKAPIQRAFEDMKVAFKSALQGKEKEEVQPFLDEEMEEIIAQILAARRENGTQSQGR